MSPSPRHAQWVLTAIVCLAAAGCHHQTAQAANPAETAPSEAAAPQPAKTGETPAVKKDGDTAAPANPNGAEAAAPGAKPPALKVPEPSRSAPKPPVTTPAPQPAPDTPSPRPAPPLISPRVSPAQQSERKQQTEKSIATAEANLHRALGHSLNDTQQDMVEKIRSFLAQSREAGEVPDWERAFVLAEKARVLSEELVNAL
jgi:hypothetical protein